jgi:hypothetical protein
MPEPDVRLDRVTKRFYDVTAVDGVSLSIDLTAGAAELLAKGQRVRLEWRPQHTFVIGPGVP